MTKMDTLLLADVDSSAERGSTGIAEPARCLGGGAGVGGQAGLQLTLVHPAGRKRSIEMRIARCETRIQSIDDRCSADMTWSSEAVDRAAELADRAMELAARQAFESQLRQARRALQRAHQGQGDVCEACGTRIQQARLEAVPETTMCIECQRRRERHLLRRTNPGSCGPGCVAHDCGEPGQPCPW